MEIELNTYMIAIKCELSKKWKQKGKGVDESAFLHSPVVRNSATFFAEDEEEEESNLQILSKDEKDLAGSRS